MSSQQQMPIRTVFDPRAVELIGRAFDQAWEEFERHGGRLAGETQARKMRELLARRIMEQAELGESDPSRLRDHALRRLRATFPQ